VAWKGKWIVAVGVIHILFGLAIMNNTLAVLWSDGLINTVNGQPEREAVFWFLVCGLLLLMIGMLIDQSERRELPVGWFVEWSFAFLTVVALVVMPISGIWLLLPPVAGLVLSRWKSGRRGAKARE
jgi:hypothetical protein